MFRDFPLEVDENIIQFIQVFFSEKIRQNGHSIQDLSFGLGLLSQPGVDPVGVLDVVMW